MVFVTKVSSWSTVHDMMAPRSGMTKVETLVGMLMFHTDSYHIGGEKFQVKIDDVHQSSCELMGIETVKTAVCFDDEDGLCGTGWLPGSQNKGSCKRLGLTVREAGSDASQWIVELQGVQSDIGVASCKVAQHNS
jgi:hypothetical protein